MQRIVRELAQVYTIESTCWLYYLRLTTTHTHQYLLRVDAFQVDELRRVGSLCKELVHRVLELAAVTFLGIGSGYCNEHANLYCEQCVVLPILLKKGE